LACQLMLLPGAAHEHVDLGHAVRLGEIVVGAELHRRDRRLDGAVAGDDDDFRRVGLRAERLERFEAVHLRHHDVDQGDVERLVAHGLERRLAVADADHVMAAPAEEGGENLREVLFVLAHEDAYASTIWMVDHAARIGKRTRNTLPSPTTLSTSMRPPCSVMIE